MITITLNAPAMNFTLRDGRHEETVFDVAEAFQFACAAAKRQGETVIRYLVAGERGYMDFDAQTGGILRGSKRMCY